MELREILRRRRMVRAYEPEPVPREAIERILRTVRRAPSAGFSQGQRLVVVTEAARRRRLAEIVGEESWVGDAPVLIIVCVREDDYHDRYREPDKLALTGGVEIEWPIPFWHFDAGATAMLLLLAAIDEGYASGLFGVFVEALPAFREELGLPADVAIACCVTIGRAADDEVSARSSRLTRRRRPLDDVVRWERW
ncbi:MAG TPA: nitroreductase family protein [Gaiellaceae bacterium]|nr:nitroreductase family protein [Gaiellaceae bacterium]